MTPLVDVPLMYFGEPSESVAAESGAGSVREGSSVTTTGVWYTAIRRTRWQRTLGGGGSP